MRFYRFSIFSFAALTRLRLTKGFLFLLCSFDDVSILSSDIVGIAALSTSMSTVDLILLINELFCSFDELVDEYGVYKVPHVFHVFLSLSFHFGGLAHNLHVCPIVSS